MMPLLSPKSIAVIGASTTEGKVGYEILKNIIEEGFAGHVYPVNPKHKEILGVKTHVSITDIQGPVDMAIIVTPAKTVPGIAKECAAKGVKTLVIISAGFTETGTEEGERMEKDIRQTCYESGMEIVGTNCLGLLRPSLHLNASFAKKLPPKGNIALISQSGALAVALMDMANEVNLGMSLVLSVGNKTLMDECDFLESVESDPETRVVGLYLENIRDGRRFRVVAERIAATKPIVLMKSGTSEHGKKAVSSHTGALAGCDAAIEAVCRQTGIHRARSSEEFLDTLLTFSHQPSLPSSNIAILTNAGGPGILATDAAECFELHLPSPAGKTKAKLQKLLPEAASTVNPIDVLGDSGVDRYKAAIDACGDDSNIDGVCVLLTPQVMTPCEEIARAIVEWNTAYPLMPVVTSFMGEESVKEARTILCKNGIPNFETPERAIRALATLQNHGSTLRQDQGKQAKSSSSDLRAARACELLESHTGLLDQQTVKELFELYAIPLPHQHLALSADEAVEHAVEIGFPVVAKVSSPDILHKVDIGGVRLNLNTKEEIHLAFREIMENAKKKEPEAHLNGVLIQKYLPVGYEFIIGGLRDPSFGPLVMVGLGGIYTELFRDTSFRLAPATQKEAYEMLRDLKSWALLLGLRGKTQSDIHGLAELLETVSQLMQECDQIKELDLNPVLVGEKEVVIADVKIVIQDHN